jgi:hypothetical protein
MSTAGPPQGAPHRSLQGEGTPVRSMAPPAVRGSPPAVRPPAGGSCRRRGRHARGRPGQAAGRGLEPVAIGLAVPGMPVGSPGMDGAVYGGRKDAYDVSLVARDGSTRVFRRYPKG